MGLMSVEDTQVGKHIARLDIINVFVGRIGELG